MKYFASIIFISFFLFGCSSGPMVKVDSSSPLKAGVTRYSIVKPVVKLTLGHGAIEGDKTFADSSTLESQLAAAMTKHFAEMGLLAANPESADASVEVTMDYVRRFNYGGKSLNKPQISYRVQIKEGAQLLAQYSISNVTTYYGPLEDAGVNLQISTFTWGAEDEPKDIDMIAKVITEEISKIGN